MSDTQFEASLKDVSQVSPSCREYIDEMPPGRKQGYVRNKSMYTLNSEAVSNLSQVIDNYEIVVLFADWCGDARRAVPVLALLEEKLGIKIRALGGMEKPGWGSSELWAVPPSPPEVKKFGVTSSPTILIFDKKTGEEVGRIRTRPRITASIEEELVELIERASSTNSMST